MKQLVLILMNTLCALSAAQASIIIQSPGSDRNAFETFLKENPSAISYSQYLRQHSESNPSQEESLYALAEKLDSPSNEIVLRLMNIPDRLSSTSINYIYDLTNKLLERKDLSKNQDLIRLNCKVRGLLSVPFDNCGTTSLDFTAMKKQWPFAQGLLLESVAYSFTTSALVQISKDAVYSFTLYSDSHKAIEFKGTYSQFMQQHFVGEPLVDGSCSGFSSNIDDFTVQSSGAIFFKRDCIKAFQDAGKSRSLAEWAQDNKAWLIPVGILLVGGAAYGLKDKKIVIDKP
ncbi:hypothetical protein [Bdellovibrio sp. HCB209]|uniref:hypothetical protein n=1 Tax=Bdellovibrio sp. HCB209 TaxID=3394354 RepID=UPI0039B370A3